MARQTSIKQTNLEKQKEGKPSAAGGQGGNTAKQIGKLAGGIGPTAVKQVQKLKKEAPDLFEQVAQGKKSAKEALREAKQRKEEAAAEAAEAKARKERQVGPGDLIYEVERVAGKHIIIEWQVCLVDTHSFECVGRKGRLHKPDAFTLEEAKAERIKRLQDEIADLDEDMRGLKAEMKKKPIVVPGAKSVGNAP